MTFNEITQAKTLKTSSFAIFQPILCPNLLQNSQHGMQIYTFLLKDAEKDKIFMYHLSDFKSTEAICVEKVTEMKKCFKLKDMLDLKIL